MSLDPDLAAATEVFGRPRFYPPGSHPATARMQQQLDQLQAFRHRLDHARLDHADTDQAIDYIGGKIAAFEEEESIRKADYLRIIDDRRNRP